MATAKKAANKVVKKAAGVAKKVVAKKTAKKTASRKAANPGAIESLVSTVKKKAKKLVRSAKRTLIEPHAGDKRYVRRDNEGKFKDVVDVGKSLSADKRTAAKKLAKPGQGTKATWPNKWLTVDLDLENPTNCEKLALYAAYRATS